MTLFQNKFRMNHATFHNKLGLVAGRLTRLGDMFYKFWASCFYKNQSDQFVCSLQKLADGIQQSLRSMDMPCFDTSTVHKLESNLHSMSRYELLQVQRKTREEKKLYRRAVKEKEERVFQETGRRKMSKDQRGDDSTYTLYKLSKSKLKLIEALLSKPGNAFIWFPPYILLIFVPCHLRLTYYIV